MRRAMVKVIKAACVVCGLIWVAGCVTTTNRVVPDVEAALSTRIQLGMKYLGIDKRDNARFQFSEALKLDAKSAEAFHGIAMVHEANGEYEPAKEAYEKALKYADDRSRSAIFVSYGRYWMESGKPEKGCDYFEKAAADYDFKRRPEALYFAAKCASATGNLARVKPAYEHALNLNDQYTPVMIELAELYFVEGSYAKSKKLLDGYMNLVTPTARSLWLGIRIERIFGNKDKEGSYALALKNRHPYSKEYLEYKNLILNKP